MPYRIKIVNDVDSRMVSNLILNVEPAPWKMEAVWIWDTLCPLSTADAAVGANISKELPWSVE